MVSRPGITTLEIADRYQRSVHTVTKTWTRHSDWPPPTGKRGRYLEYDPAEVDVWVRAHATRPTMPTSAADPDEWLTVAEVAVELGLSQRTIRADISRGRLPSEVRGGVRMLRRGDVADTLRRRRGYGLQT